MVPHCISNMLHRIIFMNFLLVNVGFLFGHSCIHIHSQLVLNERYDGLVATAISSLAALRNIMCGNCTGNDFIVYQLAALDSEDFKCYL